MTYLKHTICHILVAIFGVTVLVSCSQNEPVQETEETYKIRLRLTADGIPTRVAEWGDPSYTPDDKTEGTVFEKTIKSVDIFALDATDNTKASQLKLKKDETQENVFICEVGTKTPGVTVENNKVVFTGRIMAIVNVEDPTYPSDEVWSDTTIPYIMDSPENGWYIPMWGIEKYEGVTLNPYSVTPLEKEVYLLRAVSKIIIRLDNAFRQDYRIKEISRNVDSPRFLKQGYALPNKALEKISTLKINLEECFFPNEEARADKFDNPTFFGNDFEKYTYVSESKTPENSPFSFHVTLETTDSTVVSPAIIEGTVYFSEYNNYQPGTPYPGAVRNHIYEFTIRLSELELLTSVRKWEFGGKVHIDM